jgi:hypothetical protein
MRQSKPDCWTKRQSFKPWALRRLLRVTWQPMPSWLYTEEIAAAFASLARHFPRLIHTLAMTCLGLKFSPEV